MVRSETLVGQNLNKIKLQIGRSKNERTRPAIAIADPGTVQIVYIDCACKNVCKCINPWVFKSLLVWSS